MKKLKSLLPITENKSKIAEDLSDMDVSLPVKVDRFLDRAIQVIKGYNLPKKKEQLVVAKILDALKMSPSELNQTIQKVKKYGIVARETSRKDEYDWMGEASNLDLDQYAADFQSYFEKKYDGKSFGKWKLTVDSMSGAFYFNTKDSDVEVLATPFWDGNPKLPVDIQNTKTGDYISQKSFPLKPTGDMKKDEESYLRLIKSILAKTK